jgi:transcription initiation factor IIE alpha subunit
MNRKPKFLGWCCPRCGERLLLLEDAEIKKCKKCGWQIKKNQDSPPDNAELQSKIEQLENVLRDLASLPDETSAIIPKEVKIALQKHKVID